MANLSPCIKLLTLKTSAFSLIFLLSERGAEILGAGRQNYDIL
jgi:hypothetical protein